MRPGRNGPCPCGSGRRYKHCCGALGATAAEESARPLDIGALVVLIEQDRPAEAEHHAQLLLQGSPDSGRLWKILSVALMRQGKDALPALRRAAELLPDDAQLLIAAGNALCTGGRARESLALFQRAIEIDPRSSEAHNNLGNALQELGECAAAVGCYRQALAISPDDAETHCNLSNALRRLRQLPEAIACSERAIALAPGLSIGHNNLGLALAALGRGAQAVASFRQAVALNPRFVEALSNLGNGLGELGEHDAAVPLLRRAVELAAQRADGHYYLGHALQQLGQVAESVGCLRRAVALQPDHLLARLALATALRLQGQFIEAEAACRAVLAADQNHVAALSLLGDLHADRGEFAQAQQLFQRALALDGEFAPVYCSIAAHRRMTREDSTWLQGVEALLARSLPLQHEIGLRFALGKYHDDVRQYDAAFDHYRRANELSKRYESSYDRAKMTEHVDQMISRCDSTFARAAHPSASAAELPVFVVGMPRSGTSLIEQILASHPDAFGAGEVGFWDSACAAFAAAGSSSEEVQSAVTRIAREYLARVSALSGPVLRVVDKMPANFLYAGLIHAVFPRARILHVQRHPLDTCLSIYFQNFFRLHPYACDLDDLVHYYREYVRITNHWRTVLPRTALLEIPYEALIEDQEYWTRRMLEFIGLPWSARCLDFHRTERVVITASRWQVRQRLSAGSVGRWRNYEKHVAPLRPLLSVGVDGG